MNIDEFLSKARSLQGKEREEYLSELSADQRTEIESRLAERVPDEINTATVIQDASAGPNSDGDTVIAQTAAPVPPARNFNQENTSEFAGYELIEEIARGGMGIVFRARQRDLNRVVALKMILSGTFADENEVRRFQIEAQAAAKLSHAGIVPVFDTGEHNGCHYFSMAFVDGGSLQDKLSDGPLAPREAADILKKLAEAISYAHQNGVVHRDLKPRNVLLDDTGQPKITDFGLAMRTDLNSGITQTGAIMGTPSYMAPEQAAGRIHDVGPSSDVYALGAMLYCLLTGKPPFVCDSPAVLLHTVINEPPPPMKSDSRPIPLDLQTICLRCLEKKPQDRYASAYDLAEDLNRYLNNYPIHARRIGVATKVWRWSQRNTALMGLICVTTAALIIGIFVKLNTVSSRLHVAQEDLSKLVEQVFREHAAGDSYFEQEMHLPSFAFENLDDAVNRFDSAEQDYNFYFFGAVDDEFLYDVATAKFYIGQARRLQSRNDDAEAAIRDAIDRFLALHETAPSDQRHLLRASVAWDYLAELFRVQSRHEDAEAAYLESLSIQQELKGKVHPDNATRLAAEQMNFEQEFARTHNNYAILLLAMNRTEESREHLDEARSILSALTKREPQNAAMTMDHARTLLNLGRHDETLGSRQSAADFYEAARQQIAKLVKEFPDVPRYRFILAVCEKNRGWVLAETPSDQDPDAKKREALKLLQSAAAEFAALPDLPVYNHRHAVCRNNLGIVHGYLQEWQAARDELQKARDIADQLVRNDSEDAENRSLLGRILGGLGWTHVNLTEVDQAKKNILDAIEHQTAAWKMSPNAYWNFLAEHHFYLSTLLLSDSEPDAAAAVSHVRAAIEVAPDPLNAAAAQKYARLAMPPFSELRERTDFQLALSLLGDRNPLVMPANTPPAEN